MQRNQCIFWQTNGQTVGNTTEKKTNKYSLTISLLKVVCIPSTTSFLPGLIYRSRQGLGLLHRRRFLQLIQLGFNIGSQLVTCIAILGLMKTVHSCSQCTFWRYESCCFLTQILLNTTVNWVPCMWFSSYMYVYLPHRWCIYRVNDETLFIK